MTRHRGLELPIGHILDAPVQAQRQIATGSGFPQPPEIIDDMPETVAQNTLAPGLTIKPLIVGKLQPLLTLIVDVGEAQYMRRNLTVGVVAPVLTLHMHPGQTERHHLVGLGWRHVPANIDELPSGATHQPLSQPGGIATDRPRKLGYGSRLRQQEVWLGPDRVHRRTHRQRLTFAV